MRKLSSLVVLCIALLFSSHPLMAGNIIAGSPPDAATGNCYPFGCAYIGQYQQVYTHSLFTGPVLIWGLEFYNTEENEYATAMNSGTWIISLSTTPADWNTLSTDFASNIGSNDKLMFIGNLARPWTFGNTLTIQFRVPFAYDPAEGNLLMNVVAVGTSDLGGKIFFNTNGYNDGGDNGNKIFGRDYCPGAMGCSASGVGAVNDGYGLETGFLLQQAPGPDVSTSSAITSEPGSLFVPGSAPVGADGVRASQDGAPSH